jgi:hypothetical protein
MSNFQLTNCQGWSKPSSSFSIPIIEYLTSYYCPAGYNNLITIFGENFYSYSSISFGTYQPTTYFINSNQLQFYTPTILGSGTYPVQVFNGSIPSNVIVYTLDNSSGYWLLGGNGQISNTNANGIKMNGNTIIYGTPGQTYLQFPDGTKQTTASSNVFSNPITINYTPASITSSSQLGYTYNGTYVSITSTTTPYTNIIQNFINLSCGQWLLTMNTTNFTSNSPFTVSFFLSPTGQTQYFNVATGNIISTNPNTSYNTSPSLSYLLSVTNSTNNYVLGIVVSSQLINPTTTIFWNLTRIG